MSAPNNFFGQPAPLLCYVTDRRSLSAASPAESLAAALHHKIAEIAAAGVDWVQIREKDLPTRELAALTRHSIQAIPTSASAARRTRILVNDRLDVAIAERTDGVHLGENSLPVQAAKRLLRLGPADLRVFLVGVSCHSLSAAQQAALDGADYLVFGPVFSTPSKEVFGPPQGIERLREICQTVSIPVLAIGGITVQNAASCVAAGASGIAAIRLFQDSSDPAATVQQLRRLLMDSPPLPPADRPAN